MDTTAHCNEIVRDVLQDSAYSSTYEWTMPEVSPDAPVLNKTNGYAMTQFIAGLLKENNAPCAEEVIGLLEEFIQECTATKKDALLEELRIALNNAG